MVHQTQDIFNANADSCLAFWLVKDNNDHYHIHLIESSICVFLVLLILIFLRFKQLNIRRIYACEHNSYTFEKQFHLDIPHIISHSNKNNDNTCTMHISNSTSKSTQQQQSNGKVHNVDNNLLTSENVKFHNSIKIKKAEKTNNNTFATANDNIDENPELKKQSNYSSSIEHILNGEEIYDEKEIIIIANDENILLSADEKEIENEQQMNDKKSTYSNIETTPSVTTVMNQSALTNLSSEQQALLKHQKKKSETYSSSVKSNKNYERKKAFFSKNIPSIFSFFHPQSLKNVCTNDLSNEEKKSQSSTLQNVMSVDAHISKTMEEKKTSKDKRKRRRRKRRRKRRKNVIFPYTNKMKHMQNLSSSSNVILLPVFVKIIYIYFAEVSFKFVLALMAVNKVNSFYDKYENEWLLILLNSFVVFLDVVLWYSLIFLLMQKSSSINAFIRAVIFGLIWAVILSVIYGIAYSGGEPINFNKSTIALLAYYSLRILLCLVFIAIMFHNRRMFLCSQYLCSFSVVQRIIIDGKDGQLYVFL